MVDICIRDDGNKQQFFTENDGNIDAADIIEYGSDVVAVKDAGKNAHIIYLTNCLQNTNGLLYTLPSQ